MSTHYEYTVRPGDTLHGIIHKIYGVPMSSTQHSKCLQYLLALNPQIKDPDRIRVGDSLRITENLVSAATFSQTPPANVIHTPLLNQNVPTTGPQAAGHYAVSWLAHHSPDIILGAGGTATGFGSGLLSEGNISHIHRINELYAQYKAGIISKNQYDYRRRQTLQSFQQNMGPIDRIIFGHGGSSQKLRIARAGGVPANANLVHHSARLKQLGQLAGVGGVALTGVGLYLSCRQIGDTLDRREKNMIFVDSATSAAVGTLAGAALGVFLVSNPIGWGAMLVLATGVAASSYAAGKMGRIVYQNNFEHLDPVSGFGVDRICK